MVLNQHENIDLIRSYIYIYQVGIVIKSYFIYSVQLIVSVVL